MNLIELLLTALGQVWGTLLHNWPYLVVSTVLAAAMKLYIDKDAVAGFLRRHERGGILAATAAAVGTPLCSCGTTALVLGMMAGSMPWAPIIAFMVASPLTSPEELIYSAGLFGWPFAMAFFGASIVLGLAGGVSAGVLDARGWLRNQARFALAETAGDCGAGLADQPTAALTAAAPMTPGMPLTETCGCAAVGSRGETRRASRCGCDTMDLPLFVVAPVVCACDSEAAGGIPGTRGEAPYAYGQDAMDWIALTPSSDPPSAPRTVSIMGRRARDGVEEGRPAVRPPRVQWVQFLREVAVTGRRLLVLFLAFATIGYLINDLIPTAWITSLFGSGHAYSVPLAATLGLPFYLNTEASLPLVRGMLDSGMSTGAALAFLITGAGTSIGAVAGAMAIARWRVIGLVIGTLWVGAILCGLGWDALLATALF